MSTLVGVLWVVGTLEILVATLFVVGRATPKWCRQDTISAVALVMNTITVAIIAVFAYHEAKRQSDLTDHRSRVEHSSQLVDTDWTLSRLETGEVPIANLALSNKGRTAAYVLAGTYEAMASANLPKSFADNPRQLPSLPGVLRQGQARSIVISEHLPPIDVAALREGKQFFYLRIIVWWKDIFGDLYEMRATAKYGRIIDSKGIIGFGLEFPEVPLCKEEEVFPCQSWQLLPKDFVRLRQYNSHKLFEP